MPRKVAVLLLLLAISTLTRVVEAANSGETTAWVGVAVNVAFIFGIMRGSEGARTVLRFFAALGLIVSVIGVLMVSASGLASTQLGMIALLASGFSGVVTGFMYWCLGQEDVIAWITARRLGAE
jgi:hypothetical protein